MTLESRPGRRTQAAAGGEHLRLWEAACACPVATAADFVGPHPVLEPATSFRIVADPQLRARLLRSGMARTLQMPRGRQTFAAIVRLYPNLDAPAVTAVVSAGGRPTVEQMRVLIARIDALEAEILAGADRDDRIAALRGEITTLEGPALERAVGELRALLDAQASIRSSARATALRRIRADDGFPERRFLSVLATR